jgi:SNF2 family DNA or RNA helicase
MLLISLQVSKHPSMGCYISESLRWCQRLLQVCNHPMLSYPCYADFDPTLLVRECGKMEVLDRLLVKLHATGHRVLLFSTMTKARI